MGLGYIRGAGGGGGVTSDEVTATRADVLTGKSTVTADSADEVVDGTMTYRGDVTATLGINGTYIIPKGYHAGNGKVSQNIPTKAAATYYPGTSEQTIAAGQYLSGAQKIGAVSQENLIGANIKPGITVKIKNAIGNIFKADCFAVFQIKSFCDRSILPSILCDWSLISFIVIRQITYHSNRS